MIQLSWGEFKAHIDSKSLIVSCIESSSIYRLTAANDLDDSMKVFCIIKKKSPATADQTEFEDTYKDLCGGWKIRNLSIEYTTADDQNFYCKDLAGNNIGLFTYIMYKADDTTTTNNSLAVRTDITFVPTYSYLIRGFRLYQETAPTSDIRAFVVVAPGIADDTVAEGGENLKDMGTGNIINTSGSSVRLIKYIAAAPPANHVQWSFRHTAAYQHKIRMVLDILIQ